MGEKIYPFIMLLDWYDILTILLTFVFIFCWHLCWQFCWLL